MCDSVFIRASLVDPYGALDRVPIVISLPCPLHKSEKFELSSHAFIYGAGRDHGGMLGGDPADDNDDGCTGADVAWACANVGNLTNEQAGDDDNSDVLACLWGAKGVPDDMTKLAGTYRVSNIALVQKASDVRDLICSLKPVTVASDVGFEPFSRDSDGLCKSGGTSGL